MPEDIQYCRNMQHVLTKVIKHVVVDGSTYVNTTRTTGSKDVMLRVLSPEPAVIQLAAK
jgi:accessory colonization factor AcfC